MRWMKVCLGSLGTGVLAILLSLTLFFLGLFIYIKYVVRIGPEDGIGIGWDPVSTFGRYWELALIGIPLLIFALGCTAGFWFFNRRLRE